MGNGRMTTREILCASHADMLQKIKELRRNAKAKGGKLQYSHGFDERLGAYKILIVEFGDAPVIF